MVRRLVMALAVVAVMTGALVGPGFTVSGLNVEVGSNEAIAQPGAPEYCGPWQQSWFVSSGGWWYFWWWRWCYNPSLPPSETIAGGYFIDWSGWSWFGPAPLGAPPGFQYTGGPPG
jgi:hypothetical protein